MRSVWMRLAFGCASGGAATLKELLVHVDGTPAAADRIELGVALARRYGANLAGLHAAPLGVASLHDGGHGLDIVLGKLPDRVTVEAKEAHTQFHNRVRDRQIGYEWRSVIGPVDKQIAQHARYADLAIVGQVDPSDPMLGSAALVPSTVPLMAGRPVIVNPCAPSHATFGERVLIAWDGGREAARAVSDALLFLVAAKAVAIVSVGRDDRLSAKSDQPAAALARYLRHHGIDAQAFEDPADDADVATAGSRKRAGGRSACDGCLRPFADPRDDPRRGDAGDAAQDDAADPYVALKAAPGEGGDEGCIADDGVTFFPFHRKGPHAHEADHGQGRDFH
jgi:hypothetical protein